MFCSKCGHKCNDGVAFCEKCGTGLVSVETVTDEAQPDNGTPLEVTTEKSIEDTPVQPTLASGVDNKNGGVFEVGSVKLSGVDEDKSFIDLGGNVIDVKWILMGLSGVLALLFFLPLFRVGWWASLQRINGFTALFGRDGARSSFPALFILLIPILVALLVYFKPQIEKQVLFIKGNLFIVVAVGYALGLITLFITRSSVRGIYSFAGATVFFWLLVLAYLGTIAITTLFILSSKGIGLKVELGGNQVSGVSPVGMPMGGTLPMGTPSNYIGVQRNGVVVILLSIVTCGIYGIYFLYTVMEDINKASGEQRINSVAMLIGGILCFPIMWVTLYQVDKNLARLSRENGTHYKENFILWLLLSFVGGIGSIIAYIQICEGFNQIWMKRVQDNSKTPPGLQ
ncbi:MAG: DUF4234 domain-containing protein [Defluviitaleaceae bacterium]|nr:DUF4234 domain-containing protein [Defluviitaleaceae bacterium]